MIRLVAENPSLDLRKILQDARTIAVVGASEETWRPSFGVAAYLKRAGYRVLPVNPTIAGVTLHGEQVRAALTDLAEPVDIVKVFRRRPRLRAGGRGGRDRDQGTRGLDAARRSA